MVWAKRGTGFKKADGTPCANGDAIAKWTDSSGNGNDGVQGTALDRPVFGASAMPGGFAAGEFGNGYSPTWLDFPISIPTNAFSYFIVASKTDEVDPTNTYYSRFMSLFGGPYEDHNWDLAIAGLWNRDTNACEIQRANATVCTLPFAALAARHVIAVVMNGASVTLTIDGSSNTGSTDASPTLAATVMTLGDGNPHGRNFALNGPVSEALLFNRVLSGPEQTTVLSYLATG